MLNLLIKRISDEVVDTLTPLGLVIWDAPLLRKPHTILSLFYSAFIPLTMYIYFTYEGQFGLRQLQEHTGMAWYVWIAIFSIANWVVTQTNKPHIYAMCIIPMGVYTFNILFNLNDIGDLGMLAVLYLMWGMLATLSSLRVVYEQGKLLKKMHALEDAVHALNTNTNHTPSQASDAPNNDTMG